MTQSESWFDYGRRLIHDTYVDGGDVYEASQFISKSTESSEGLQAFDGAIQEALLMLTTAARGGVRFATGEGESVKEIAEAIRSGDFRFALLRYRSLSKEDAFDWRYAMFKALEEMRSNGIATFQKYLNAKEPEKPAAPIQVELISMPGRKTTTAISRDDTGNIVTSAQIETDL